MITVANKCTQVLKGDIIMKKLITIVLATVMAMSVFTGCSSEVAGAVSTDGSTSMEKVIGYLSEAYMEEKTDVKVTYNPTGSGSGIQAVLEGRCDIGLSSRDLKDEEKAELNGTVVAIDGIAVIVNPENPVDDLTIEQIAGLYKGEITNFENKTIPRSPPIVNFIKNNTLFNGDFLILAMLSIS